MSARVVDRLRIEGAVVRYDLWLDLHGVPGRRRRDLRRELRSNLQEAGHDVGVRAAVRRLGGVRELAADSVVSDRNRPAWTVGLLWAAGSLVLLLWLTLLQAAAFADGVAASGVGRPVSGELTLLPGVGVEAHVPDDGGLSIAVTGSWSLLVVPLLVLVVAARPWRLAGRRRREVVGP
ncbi:hypothetical protein [Thalassiella azotivora]